MSILTHVYLFATMRSVMDMADLALWTKKVQWTDCVETYVPKNLGGYIDWGSNIFIPTLYSTAWKTEHHQGIPESNPRSTTEYCHQGSCYRRTCPYSVQDIGHRTSPENPTSTPPIITTIKLNLGNIHLSLLLRVKQNASLSYWLVGHSWISERYETNADH